MIEQFIARTPLFVTLKDYKGNFRFNPTCCLINPSKNELGKVSKQLVKKINSDIVGKLQFNRWHNTDVVLKWFSNITGKSNWSFNQFGILPINNSEHSTPNIQICKTAYKHWQERPTHYKPLPQVVTIFW